MQTILEDKDLFKPSSPHFIMHPCGQLVDRDFTGGIRILDDDNFVYFGIT